MDIFFSESTLLLIVLMACFFWIAQWLDLMSMKDEDFPGRYDKILWGGLMVFSLVFGAATFWLWKRKRSRPQRIADLARQHLRTKPRDSDVSFENWESDSNK